MVLQLERISGFFAYSFIEYSKYCIFVSCANLSFVWWVYYLQVQGLSINTHYLSTLIINILQCNKELLILFLVQEYVTSELQFFGEDCCEWCYRK